MPYATERAWTTRADGRTASCLALRCDERTCYSAMVETATALADGPTCANGTVLATRCSIAAWSADCDSSLRAEFGCVDPSSVRDGSGYEACFPRGREASGDWVFALGFLAALALCLAVANARK